MTHIKSPCSRGISLIDLYKSFNKVGELIATSAKVDILSSLLFVCLVGWLVCLLAGFIKILTDESSLNILDRSDLGQEKDDYIFVVVRSRICHGGLHSGCCFSLVAAHDKQDEHLLPLSTYTRCLFLTRSQLVTNALY